ncbi:MAG: exosome complex exonuclease Rrp41 [Candidatus Woesearchaeota archaeon]
MAYKKRIDGRTFEELRPMQAKAGVIGEADGSGFFKIGNTAAYATVFGPKDVHPRFLEEPGKGVLRVNYTMMPFSGMGDRVRPGPNRRSRELNLVIQKALSAAVDLTQYQGSMIDVFIELPETDAGSRCASICAAAIALADAGIIMKDMVAAVSVGRVDNQVVVDLDYAEEAYEGGPVADIPVAMLPITQELSLLQLDGEVDKDILLKALALAKDACETIKQTQIAAIKAKYEVE